jgi:hypothetical protein
MLIRHFLHIALCLLPFCGFSQDQKTTTWKSEKDYLEYRKEEKYQGPSDWYGSYPADIKDKEYNNSTYGNSSGYKQGIQYTPQKIQKDRQKRYQGFERGGGNGTVPFDPKVQDPDPIELPDVDAPDVNLPDVDIDPPTISPTFWKIIGFILIAALVLFLVYFFLKNRKAPNKKVVVDVENDWNPEVISKTELELRLEEAVEREDYRECVRIYFTFILKELIRKGWINWKKEKTNYHYVLEMHKRENAAHFNECVRIYDLVWYGDYNIDQDIFGLLQPSFENYYKSLDPVNE